MQKSIIPAAMGGPLFIGLASRGPARRPVVCNRFEDFVNQFGASTPNSELAGSVSLFFQNGGKQCTIVRLERGTRAEYQAVWRLLPAAVASSEFLILPRVTGAGVEPRERLWASVSRLCRATRTLLLVDPPDTWRTASDAVRGVDALANTLDREYSALFFPPLRSASLTPLISPAGAVAGVLAQQKPWSATGEEPPSLRDVRGTATPLTTQDLDMLTKKAINPIRELPKGSVVWGVRTLAGAEGQINDYRYIAVRRLANHIERSILVGTAWARTERNEQALWSNLQTLAENFLMDLWRELAFQGTALHEAFFARCGQKTTTQADRNNKNAILVVGFAPIRPKEFVLFRIPIRTAG